MSDEIIRKTATDGTKHPRKKVRHVPVLDRNCEECQELSMKRVIVFKPDNSKEFLYFCQKHFMEFIHHHAPKAGLKYTWRGIERTGNPTKVII